jgi:hypothetical protein
MDIILETLNHFLRITITVEYKPQVEVAVQFELFNLKFGLTSASLLDWPWPHYILTKFNEYLLYHY